MDETAAAIATYAINAGWQSLVLLAKRFVWSSPTVTRSAPHIRDATSVQRVWVAGHEVRLH